MGHWTNSSPFRVDMYCVKSGSDLRNLYRCGELWKRGDKNLIEEFFNLSEEIVQKLKFRRSENAVHMQAEQKVGRPTCTTWCTAAVQLTEQSTDCTSRVSVKGRSVDRLAWTQVSVRARSTEWRVGRPERSTDRRICLSNQDSNSVSDPDSNPIEVF